MADKSCDLLIIGSGPGGYRAGELAGKAGFKVIVVEKEKQPGGVCLNWGCIPTKTLLKSAKVLNYIQHSSTYGIETEQKSVKVMWEKMQARKAEVVKKLNSGVEMLLRGNKAELVYGEAEVIDEHTMKVGSDKISFKNLFLATGSLPFIIPLPGFEEAFKSGAMIDSTGALSLSEIPKTLTVIGGGVIGIEFAFIYSQLGTQVTIIQGMDRVLEKMDRDVSDEMQKIIQSKGIKLILNAKVTSFNVKTNQLHYDTNGQNQTISSDKTLLAVGRKPVTELAKKLNVAVDQRGLILVDAYQRTNKPHIYAIGDCCTSLMLAHVAYAHARIAVRALKNEKTPYKIENVPSCIYSFPEVAAVGLTEEEAKARNKPYSKIKVPMRILGKALADGEEQGFLKLIVDNEFGELLGCHIVGSTATDMISELVLMMESESTIHELVQSIHPHPTLSEIVGDAALDLVHKMSKAAVAAPK